MRKITLSAIATCICMEFGVLKREKICTSLCMDDIFSGSYGNMIKTKRQP
jgi:hypothetical protein